MAQNNQPNVQEEQVVNTVSGLEQFFNKHKNLIEWILIAIIVVVFGFLALNKWYVTPAKEEAQGQMFKAESYFAAGDFTKALEGDGNALGFADVISTYGSKAGKSAYLYAGICELQRGNNDEAISYLKKYNGKDDILKARALCCLGDAYANKGELATAVANYKKAAATADNLFAASYLLKAGITSEELGDNAAALKFYKEIEDRYPASIEGIDIEKYIQRIENQK